MELTHEFEIGRPVAEVWTRLLDLRNVAVALPGASVDDVESDGTHHGSLRLKLGSFVASFRGTARYTEVDDARHRVVLVARGNSAQGQASVQLEGAALPGPRDGTTTIQLVSRVTLSGRIANFGARLATDVARQVLDQFVTNLTASFEAAPSEGGTAAKQQTGTTAGQGAAVPAADLLDLGSVLTPAWLTRPVPLPIALLLALAGVVLGSALSRPRRAGSLALAVPPRPPASPETLHL